MHAPKARTLWVIYARVMQTEIDLYAGAESGETTRPDQKQLIMKQRTHLVVGARGLIGCELAQSFSAFPASLISAATWRGALQDNQLFLDLATEPSQWVIPDGVRTAYLCAGMTKLDNCRKNPEISWRVNVTGTLALVRALIARGIFVVFLSSCKVFDGTIPNIPADSPHNPLTEYGKQKAAVERVLLETPDRAAVVRLTKVFGPDSLFEAWTRQLLAGIPIRPFADMNVSPIPLKTVISVLRLVGERQLGGIWQISDSAEVSYSDAALWGAKVLRADPALIRPWSIAEAGLDLEVNAPYASTTMNAERLREELGLEPPSVRWTIETLFKNYAADCRWE